MESYQQNSRFRCSCSANGIFECQKIIQTCSSNKNSNNSSNQQCFGSLNPRDSSILLRSTNNGNVSINKNRN